MNKKRIIETDNFDFEFISPLAERESWRKEIHRPIYHLHKWWAKRLGSVFRGILLGALLPEDQKISDNFYLKHNFAGVTVFDPFMGSGTTIGEAHKIGLTALGRDINPVAVESVRVALGPIDEEKVEKAYDALEKTVGKKIVELYKSTDEYGMACDVLYYFWVMQADCPDCHTGVDLFSSWVISRHAYPHLKPEIQILCPKCGNIFADNNKNEYVTCRLCEHRFLPHKGNISGQKAQCLNCNSTFSFRKRVSLNKRKPKFRLYGKLMLKKDGNKHYCRTDEKDLREYKKISEKLKLEVEARRVKLPELRLQKGFNTTQAIEYGFEKWEDFFNDRQLLALGWLQAAITTTKDTEVRDLLLLSFSGALEFNNMFASYKGEGTGAVRHMFAHHILKPERTPIEANVWGIPKSSGSFSGLFQNRVHRAISYRNMPTEVQIGKVEEKLVCSSAFTGQIERWPDGGITSDRGIYLSCGDSSDTHLRSKSINLIVTDPPFFDNVHYSELADFFFAWQQLIPRGFLRTEKTTRSKDEVQDGDPTNFSLKLQAVFRECHRVLKDDGLLLFTYHHSRSTGWESVGGAVISAGFTIINAQPVKSEMSVATPKSQAKEPIQIDIILVCRKSESASKKPSYKEAFSIAQRKIKRLELSGLRLSKNDKLVVMYGQLLTCFSTPKEVSRLTLLMEQELEKPYNS